MKKILFNVSYYAPHLSGLTLCIQNLAESLAKNEKEYHIRVLTTQFKKELPLTETKKNVTINRVPYVFKISKGFFMPSYVLEAFRTIKKNDIVILVLPEFEGLITALLTKLLRKKLLCYYICDVHLNGGFVSVIIETALRFVNRLCLSLADETLTLTQDFAENTPILKKRKEIKELLPIVHPLAVDTQQRRTFINNIPQERKYYIGYLGRMASEKGLEYLLASIPLLQKELGATFCILLAGPKDVVGEEIYKQKIADSMKKYPEFILQLGELSENSLGAFYSLLDVFVLPSVNQTEAFGMVQIQAMRLGVPVVATNLPGVRVAVKKTGMGLIVPIKDSHALADACLKIINKKIHVPNNVDSIEEEFSERAIIRSFNKIIAS